MRESLVIERIMLYAHTMTFQSTTSNATLMQNARQALSGKWGPTIGTFLVFMLFWLLLDTIPAVGWAIGLIFNGPIMVGLLLYALTLVHGKSTKFSLAFEGFNTFFAPSVTTNLLIALFLFLWALFFIIPAIVGGAIIHSQLPESLFSGDSFFKLKHHGYPMMFIKSLHFEELIKLFLSLVVLVVVLIPLTIPLIMAALSYSMSFLLIADKQASGALEIIKMSKERMRGNRSKLFRLSWRFFGWFLLSILTLGVGFLWFIPYMMVTVGQFYTDLKEKK